jgi:hypothetical protein
VTSDAIARDIQLADAATLTERFASPTWGEQHSGSYLAEKLAHHAGTTKPAIGVVMALNLALVDYADSLGGAAQFVIPTLEMRMPQIADLVTATPQDAEALRAALAEVAAADNS